MCGIQISGFIPNPRLRYIDNPDDGLANRAERRHPTEGLARPKFSTVDQVAAYLQITPKSVRNYVRDGRIPAYRIPGLRGIRLRLDEVDRELRLIPAGRIRLPRNAFGPNARITELAPVREPIMGILPEDGAE